MMRKAALLAALATLALWGCGSGGPAKPASTALVERWDSLSGDGNVQRGELVGLVLTAEPGAFDEATWLESGAFEWIQVVEVESSERLYGFGKVHLGAALDRFDVVAISGAGVFAARDAVTVVPTDVVELGSVSAAALSATGVFEVPRDFDVFAYRGDPLDEGSARLRVEAVDAAVPRLELHDAAGATIRVAESGCMDVPVNAGVAESIRVDDAGLGGGDAFGYTVRVDWLANAGCTTGEASGDNDTVGAPDVLGGSPGKTLCGAIDPPGDVDVWAVPISEGQALEIDVDAERLGSPLDASVRVLSTLGTFVIGAADEAVSEGQRCSADPELIVAGPGPGPQVANIEIRAVGNAAGSGFHTYRIHLR